MPTAEAEPDSAARPAGSAPADSAWNTDEVRSHFPILARPLSDGLPLIYFDTAASAQKPRAVIDAVSDCYASYYANVHRGIHSLGDRVTAALEAARERIQRFLNAASPEEVVFTAGTTASINLVAGGWGRKFLRPGDEIVVSQLEHHANLVPWQEAARATGAVLKFLPVDAEGRLDAARFDEPFSARTKILSMTAVSNVTGAVTPLADLAARARARGAVVVVDAAQAVPHGPFDVCAADADFVAFSGHKLYGPSGVGVLWGKRERLEEMDPVQFGGNMIREVGWERSTWADLPAKFEAGTLPIVPAIGLGAALEFLDGLGWARIQARERALAKTALARLSGVRGLRLLGPGDLRDRLGIFSFTLEPIHPHDLAELLNGAGVAVRAGHHCTMPLHDHWGIAASTRVSLGLYNTEEELDALVAALESAKRVFRMT